MEEEFSLERLKNELEAAEARLAGARSRKAAAEAELASKTSERDRASADAGVCPWSS